MDHPDVSVAMLGSGEVRAWQIPNERFETIEAEIKFGDELDLGTGLVRDRFEWRQWNVYPVTFLFITKQDGRGILQVLGPSSERALDMRVRYRLFDAVQAKPAPLAEKIAASLRPATSPTERYGAVHQVTLYKPQAADKVAAIDFDTGEVRPQAVEPDDPRASDAKRDWLRSWHGDAMAMIDAKHNLFAMEVVGTKLFEVSRGSFDRLSARDAEMILARGDASWGYIRKVGNDKNLMVDWVFRTSDGASGVLTVDQLDSELVNFRYKLIEPTP
jgi:hypothetical protein